MHGGGEAGGSWQAGEEGAGAGAGTLGTESRGGAVSVWRLEGLSTDRLWGGDREGRRDDGQPGVRPRT